MRNTILRLIYGVAVFIAAVFLFEHTISRSGEGMTGEVSGCSFPYMVLDVGGEKVDVLYGEAREADPVRIRPLLLPLSGDRTLEATLFAENAQVRGARYELRSIDGARLIEDGTIDLFPEGDGRYGITTAFNSLINTGMEYLLKIVVSADGRDLNYYVRVMETDLDEVLSMLDFARQFHRGALDRKGQDSVVPYIETEPDGPDGDYGSVNIHSSYATITYGQLDPVELMEPAISILDLRRNIALLEMRYLVSVSTAGTTSYLECRESFRLRKGQERVYLLEYDRTMEQVFDPASGFAAEDDSLRLGILPGSPEIVCSDGGAAFAFVQAGRLYAVMPGSSQVTAVYAADAPGDTDLRSFHRDCRIDILNVDEGGNVFFAVSGYMNRGAHEGETGIYVASCSAAYRTVEELIFIPFEGSAELLMSETGQLIYHNSGDYLYTFIDGRILRIRLADRSIEVIAEGLTEGEVCFSGSRRMAAFLKEADSAEGESGAKLVLYDFSMDRAQEIAAGEGEAIRPLEFIGEDLMYGIGRHADQAGGAGVTGRFLMYSLNIVDYALNRQTHYEAPGFFVVSAEVSDGMVTLKRVKEQENGRFAGAEDDQILLAREGESGAAQVTAAQDEILGRIYNVRAKGMRQDAARLIEPRLQIIEEPRTRTVEGARPEGYLVYSAGSVSGYYADASEAVAAAERSRGTAVDMHSHSIWSRVSRSERNQIMAIRGSTAPAGTGALDACAATMSDFLGGGPVEGTASDAEEAVRLLEGALPEAEVIRLDWCSLDDVLYYVDMEVPVIALTEAYTGGGAPTAGSGGEDEEQFSGPKPVNGAYLIVGFNEQIIVVVDPATGELRRVNKTKAADELSLTGSYITCLFF
ncbi:MAG: hypothetical protein II759_04795 [Lachnospiraceae bacterium]|nr:hypothetical protein [Lachnospiraceae bacterium]